MTSDAGADLRRLVFFSLLTALCPFIPVPFLDDWARDLLRRRLCLEQCRRCAADVGDEGVAVLACGPSAPVTAGGCVGGCLVHGVLKPTLELIGKLLTKIFRTVLIFLTAKDSIDTFSETFHVGYLVAVALERSHLADPRPERILAVRRAVEITVAGVDHRPIEQLARRAFRGSRRLLRRAAANVGGLLRRLRRSGQDELRGDLPLDQEAARLAPLVERLAGQLASERGYLDHLRATLEENLTRLTPL